MEAGETPTGTFVPSPKRNPTKWLWVGSGTCLLITFFTAGLSQGLFTVLFALTLLLASAALFLAVRRSHPISPIGSSARKATMGALVAVSVLVVLLSSIAVVMGPLPESDAPAAGFTAPHSTTPAIVNPLAGLTKDHKRVAELVAELPGEFSKLDNVRRAHAEERMTRQEARELTTAQASTVVDPRVAEFESLRPTSEWVPAYNAAQAAWSRFDSIISSAVQCYSQGPSPVCSEMTINDERLKLAWDEAAFKVNARLVAPIFAEPMGVKQGCDPYGSGRCVYLAVQNNYTEPVAVAVVGRTSPSDPGKVGAAWQTDPKENSPWPGEGDVASCNRFAQTSLEVYMEVGRHSSISQDVADGVFEVECHQSRPQTMLVLIIEGPSTVRLTNATRTCQWFGSYETC